MPKDQDPELDWTHPPPGVEPLSLWDCLHDAELRTVRSDLAEGTLELSFDVPHLRAHVGLPEDLSFEFCLGAVEAVRVVTYAHLEVPAPSECVGMSLDDQLRLKGECFRKGRVETVGWDRLEAALGEVTLEVTDAVLLRGEERVTLRLDGMLDSKDWYQLTARARHLAVRRSDGAPCGLEVFIGLGQAYWDAFSERRAE